MPTTTGGWLGSDPPEPLTRTLNRSVVASPSVSSAVIVTVAVPFFAPRTRIPLLATQAFAICGLELSADRASASPSGSANSGEGSSLVVPPSLISIGSTVPTASGARLGTVTVNSWTAVIPSVSVAMTMTGASPFWRPTTVTVPPETETAMTDSSRVTAT